MAGKAFATKNLAATVVTFTPTIPVAGGTQYANLAAVAGQPQIATIKHTIPPFSQTDAIDRHLVQFQWMIPDVVGKAHFHTVGVTLNVSRIGLTRAILDDQIAYLREFFADATRVTGLLAGDY